MSDSNVEQLIAAAIAGFRSHPGDANADDMANACLNLALRAGLVVLNMSDPSSVENNRAALLEGIAAVHRHIEQWPIDDSDTDKLRVWN